MLQGILVKKVLDLVMKQVLKQFKLDKVLDYVEKPNDLDKQVEVLQKTVNKYGKYIEELEKSAAMLKKDSHPSQEFICCVKCGCKITKRKIK